MPDRQCLQCGRVQPGTAVGDKCYFCGADLPPVPEAVPAAPPPPPAQQASLPTVIEPETRPCPNCGEMLYASERRCWRCGQELEPAPEAQPEPAEPVAPPPPVAPPAIEVPTPTEAPAAPVPPPPPAQPPYAAPAPAGPAVNQQAQVLGIWALVVGIVGLMLCGGVLSPIALYLGLKANRTGRNSLGTAGVVLGLIGTVLLVVWVGLLVLGLWLNSHQAPVTAGGTSM